MNKIEILKAISDPKRYKILELISKNNDEMCACSILKHFEITQPTLCHDLNVLQKAGLITCRKKNGKCKSFKINKEAISFLVSELKKIGENT